MSDSKLTGRPIKAYFARIANSESKVMLVIFFSWTTSQRIIHSYEPNQRTTHQFVSGETRLNLLEKAILLWLKYSTGDVLYHASFSPVQCASSRSWKVERHYVSQHCTVRISARLDEGAYAGKSCVNVPTRFTRQGATSGANQWLPQPPASRCNTIDTSLNHPSGVTITT